MSADAGFGIYIHWPFCAARCPYCDFNVEVRREIDQAAWAEAFCAELQAWAERGAGRSGDGTRPVDSVFFGGGTPSLMAPEGVGAVLETIDALWGLPQGAEITLEANPTSAEADKFRGFAAAGVNRISLGVQALSDADLRTLGRRHDAAQALAAYDLARASVPRVSFDLIYARPGQTREAWTKELRQALDLAVDHLSLYQLTLEPGTPFYALAQAGKLETPDEDLAASLYEDTQILCAEAGMAGYETSNHAKPGAESRHNLIYWRNGEYVGVGPGAHGRVTLEGRRLATSTILSPNAWHARVMEQGLGLAEEQVVSPAEQAQELLLMGLRLTEGVSLRRYEALAGHPLKDEAVKRLESDGLIRLSGDRLQVTERGRPVLNALLAELA